MDEKIGYSHADFPLFSGGLYSCFLVFATAEKSHAGELCPVHGNGHHCHLCC